LHFLWFEQRQASPVHYFLKPRRYLFDRQLFLFVSIVYKRYEVG